jgi:hypothetical protein
MPNKILHRCTICKKFHASYLVEDLQLGRSYLCYSCWKARQSSATTQSRDKPGTASERQNAERPSQSERFNSPNPP